MLAFSSWQDQRDLLFTAYNNHAIASIWRLVQVTGNTETVVNAWAWSLRSVMILNKEMDFQNIAHLFWFSSVPTCSCDTNHKAPAASHHKDSGMLLGDTERPGRHAYCHTLDISCFATWMRAFKSMAWWTAVRSEQNDKTSQVRREKRTILPASNNAGLVTCASKHTMNLSSNQYIKRCRHETSQGCTASKCHL